MTSCCIPQLSFSFYQHRPIRADFSGGQITSDAGLLPLRAFDQRHHLTRDWAALLDDPRREESVRHDELPLLRQRIYQIVAGYEDANDADRFAMIPSCKSSPIRNWESRSARNLLSAAGRMRLPRAAWCI